MSEWHTSTSWTGISHSAGPAFGVEHSIRSEIPAISPFVDRLNIVIKRCRCVPGSETEVEVSLREALANAIVHGNLEDPNKHVHVGCRCVSDAEVSIVVRDEGKGFTAPNSLIQPP
jgi:anti-sigma regulatory factor (Ser/Thr protein kinase)